MRATAIGIRLSSNEHKPTNLSCTSQSAGVRQVGCWIINSVGIPGRHVEVDAANAQSAGKQISVSDPKHARDAAATGKAAHINPGSIDSILPAYVAHSIQRKPKPVERM